MNPLGLYSLVEMRELVRRWLDTFRPGSVSLSTGEEGGIPYLNPLVTKQDIDYFINGSITTRSLQLNLVDESLLTDELLIDVESGRVEYELPDDLAILRALYWKYPTVSLTIPVERHPMHMVDDSTNTNVDERGVPTYRRRINFIVLNDTPITSNVGGILVDYIKWLLPLINDEQVLETQFARLLQEVVILDAAIDATVAKLKMDPTPLIAIRQPKETTLLAAVTASTMPKETRLVTRTAIVRPRSRRLK